LRLSSRLQAAPHSESVAALLQTSAQSSAVEYDLSNVFEVWVILHVNPQITQIVQDTAKTQVSLPDKKKAEANWLLPFLLAIQLLWFSATLTLNLL
jgi:hypothetical protein